MKSILLPCAVLICTTALYAQDAREDCQPRLVLPTNPPKAYSGGHSVPLSSLPSNCSAPSVAEDFKLRPFLPGKALPPRKALPFRKTPVDLQQLLKVGPLFPKAEPREGFITTPDGAKIHYIEAGQTRTTGKMQIGGTPPPGAMVKGQVAISDMRQQPSILFVPGWTMPAWIWEQQIPHFAKSTRVVAMDPRSQGKSSKEAEGHYPAARARDIKAVIDQLKLAPAVLVGWSMGVTEIAAYVDQFGTDDIAGIVLVDGVAGGMDANFAKFIMEFGAKLQQDRPKQTESFIRSMYRKPQSEEYIQRVTKASLQTPTNAAMALFVGAFGADYRPALPKMKVPTVIFAAGDDQSNPFMAKYREMQAAIPGAKLEQSPGCGHALFADDPARFNSLLEQFLAGIGK